MKLEFLILCNNAFTDASGSLNIIQTFDSIRAVTFPAMHPKASIVVKLLKEDESDTYGQYTQKIIIQNKKTQEKIAQSEVTIDLSKIKNNLQLINDFFGLQFKSDGIYEIILNFKNVEYKTDFSVVKISDVKN